MLSWTVGLTMASVEAALPTTSHFYERCIMRTNSPPVSQGYIPLQIYSLVPLAMLSLVIVIGCYLMIVRAVRTHVKRRARTRQPIIVVQEVDGESPANYGAICQGETSTYEPPVASVCTPSDFPYSGDESGGETLYLTPVAAQSVSSQLTESSPLQSPLDTNSSSLSTPHNPPSPPNSCYSSSPCTPNVSSAHPNSENNDVTTSAKEGRKDSVTYRLSPPKDEEDIDVESCLRRCSVEELVLKQAGKMPKSNFLSVPTMPNRRKSVTENFLSVPGDGTTDSNNSSLNGTNGSSTNICLAVPDRHDIPENVVQTSTKLETNTLCIPTSPISSSNCLVVAPTVGICKSASDSCVESADTIDHGNDNDFAPSKTDKNPLEVPNFRRTSSPGSDVEDQRLLARLKTSSHALPGNILPVPPLQDCIPPPQVTSQPCESPVAEVPSALPDVHVGTLTPRSPLASPMRTRRHGVTALPPEFKVRRKSDDFLTVPPVEVELERRPSAPQLVPFTGRFLAVPPINIAKERRVSAPSYSADTSDKSKPHRESIACSNPTRGARVDKNLKKPKRESIAVSTPRWKTSLRSLLSLRSHEEEVIEEEEEEEEEEEMEEENSEPEPKDEPIVQPKRRISWNLPLDQCDSEETSSKGDEDGCATSEGTTTIDLDGSCVRYQRSDDIAGDDVSLREDSGIHMPGDANHVATLPVVPDEGERDLYLSVPRRRSKRILSRERLSTISFSSDRSLSRVSTVSQASSYSGNEFKSRSRTATMDRSAARRSVYITMTFLLAWMPLPIFILVGCFINDPFIYDAETVAYVLMLGSRILHPILYACFNKGFRTEFKRILRVMVCTPTAPQERDN